MEACNSFDDVNRRIDTLFHLMEIQANLSTMLSERVAEITKRVQRLEAGEGVRV